MTHRLTLWHQGFSLDSFLNSFVVLPMQISFDVLLSNSIHVFAPMISFEDVSGPLPNWLISGLTFQFSYTIT